MPVRQRSPVQGLPRQGGRDAAPCGPALRRHGVRTRLGGAARPRARGDGNADPEGGRPLGDPLHAAADGLAGARPAERRCAARRADPDLVGGRRPRPRATHWPGRWRPSPAPLSRRVRCPPTRPTSTDLIDAGQPLRVLVHSGFDFWLEDAEAADESARAGLDRANEVVSPTARLASVEGAYWMQLGDRRQVRWVLPEDEAPLVDALARLQVGCRSRARAGHPVPGVVPRQRPGRPGLGPTRWHRGRRGRGRRRRLPRSGWTRRWPTSRRSRVPGVEPASR